MHLLFVIRFNKQTAEQSLCNASLDSTPPKLYPPKHLVEGRWSLFGKDLGAGCLGNAVRKGEFEILGEELLDVWALDIVALLELDDLEDLFGLSV